MESQAFLWRITAIIHTHKITRSSMFWLCRPSIVYVLIFGGIILYKSNFTSYNGIIMHWQSILHNSTQTNNFQKHRGVKIRYKAASASTFRNLYELMGAWLVLLGTRPIIYIMLSNKCGSYISEIEMSSMISWAPHWFWGASCTQGPISIFSWLQYLPLLNYYWSNHVELCF